MRQRRRLEESLAMDADLARRVDDIQAYFDLAREGEAVVEDLRKEIDQLREVAPVVQGLELVRVQPCVPPRYFERRERTPNNSHEKQRRSIRLGSLPKLCIVSHLPA